MNNFRSSIGFVIIMFLSFVFVTCSPKKTTPADNNNTNTAAKPVNDTIFWLNEVTPGSVYNSSLSIHPSDWVNDFEKIFSQNEQDTLNALIKKHEQETGNEIAIVTVDSSYVKDEPFNEYALKIHRVWGVGKKEKNNGMVILISAALGKIRISNGYGINPILSNEQTQQIIDTAFIPFYRKGNYFKGTHTGLLAILKAIK